MAGGRAGSGFSGSGSRSGASGAGFGSSGGTFRPGKPKAKPAARRSASGGKVLELEVGDRVNHDKYGLGTVKNVDGSGTHTTVIIDFGSQGTVRLMLFGGVPMEKL